MERTLGFKIEPRERRGTFDGFSNRSRGNFSIRRRGLSNQGGKFSIRWGNISIRGRGGNFLSKGELSIRCGTFR